MSPTLLCLAAGLGSRFGGPKQLAALGPSGETILDFSVHDALAAGFDRVVLVVRAELHDAFARGLVARWGARVPIALVDQPTDASREKPWGTAHAVLSAADVLDAPFAVVNGDDFYGRDAYATLGAFLSARRADEPTYAVVGFPLGATLSPAGGVNRAVLTTDAGGLLAGAEEVRGIEALPGGDGVVRAPDAERVIPAATPVSMNMWGFTPAVFPQLERLFAEFRDAHAGDGRAEFLLPSAVGQLVAEGAARAHVLPGRGPWFGMTYPADVPNVVASLARVIARGEYPNPAWA